MEVLFLKPFRGIAVGETHKVKDGYARNFLIRQGIALPINHPLAQKRLVELRKEAANKRIEKESILKALEAQDGKVLTITAKMTKRGKLYGSLSEERVAALLGVAREYLEMPVISDKGEYEAYLKFAGERVAKIKILLEEEKKSK